MPEPQKEDFRERFLQEKPNKLPSFSGQLDAIVREAIKDVRSTVHQVAWGQPEGLGEPGAPMNPTQQLVTQDLKNFHGYDSRGDVPTNEPPGGGVHGKNESPKFDRNQTYQFDLKKVQSQVVDASTLRGPEVTIHGKQEEGKPMEQQGGIQEQAPEQDPMAAYQAQMRAESAQMAEAAQAQSQEMAQEVSQDQGMER